MVDELQLMRGRGIKVGDFFIKPLSIGEIEELTEFKYFQYISIIGINKDSFQVADEDVTIFDLVFITCTREEDFRQLFLKSFSCFTRQEVKMYVGNDNYFFYTENEEECKFISKENYDDIIEVIKLQNCLTKKNEEDEDNPADEKTRQILERQKRARVLLEKAKKTGDGEPLTLADLVSILISNGNGVNPFNVWDMHFYMFNNQFNRMKMLEEYDINIRSLLAGAKAEDIDLKHWMGKIK